MRGETRERSTVKVDGVSVGNSRGRIGKGVLGTHDDNAKVSEKDRLPVRGHSRNRLLLHRVSALGIIQIRVLWHGFYPFIDFGSSYDKYEEREY